MDYRPREIAVRKGRLRRARLAIVGTVCVALLGGVCACFLVPQARLSTFSVSSRLYGLSPLDEAVEGRPITRSLILESMGATGSEYNMFTSASRLKENLSSAWFVSDAAEVKVSLTPFSASVSFQDVYPLAATSEGDIYLSSGEEYTAFSSEYPEILEAYPDPDAESLVTVPYGTVDGVDYGGEEELTELLVELAPIDPEILATGYLKWARRAGDSPDLYLYFDFSEGESDIGASVLIPEGMLESFTGSEMVTSLKSVLTSVVTGGTEVLEGEPSRWTEDAFTGREWYHLRFARTDSGRFGIFWLESSQLEA